MDHHARLGVPNSSQLSAQPNTRGKRQTITNRSRPRTHSGYAISALLEQIGHFPTLRAPGHPILPCAYLVQCLKRFAARLTLTDLCLDLVAMSLCWFGRSSVGPSFRDAVKMVETAGQNCWAKLLGIGYTTPDTEEVGQSQIVAVWEGR